MVLLCIYYAINKLTHYFIVIIHIVSMFYYAISTVFILHLLCKEKSPRLVYLRALTANASRALLQTRMQAEPQTWNPCEDLHFKSRCLMLLALVEHG